MADVRKLTALDKALLAVGLPLLGTALVLHLVALATTGLAQPPVFLEGPRSGQYPRVVEYNLRPGGGGYLRAGDRVLRVGGVDMRGRGEIEFRGLVARHATVDGTVSVLAERDGHERAFAMALVRHPAPWANTPGIVLGALVCVLILLRANDARMARLFYAGTLLALIGQLPSYGLSYSLTIFYWTLFFLSTLGTPLILRALTLFPRGGSIPAPIANVWSLGVGVFYFVARIGDFMPTALGQSIPPSAGGLMADAFLLVSMVAVVTWNYVHADPAGRRKLKWLLFGGYLGAAPLALMVLTPLLTSVSLWSAPLWVLSSLGIMAVSLCVLIGIVRDNLFDIDRLIGATASYSLVLAGAVAILLTGVQWAAAPLGAALGVGASPVQVALAMAVAAGAVAAQRSLRPRIDAIFFPERVALEGGADRLRVELGATGSSHALLTLLAERVDALLRPSRCVLQAFTRADFAAAFARPSDAVATLSAEAITRLPERPTPTPDGGIWVPIRAGRETAACLELGPKRSGDLYTPTEVAILTGLAERASAELTRFRHAASAARSQRRIQDLRGERDRAESESHEKTLLLASTSHDLRQPLHALGLFAESLAERELDPESRALVEKIRSSSEALESSFSSLLDLSRIDAGAIEPDVEDVPLPPLLRRLEREFADAAEAKELRLRFRSSDLAVRSDAVLLGRIVQNLVSNAIRYTERGKVEILADREGERVRISVRDSGPGIPEEAQRSIFGEFQRLEPQAGRPAGGAGLGLAIVDRLARLLDHDLTLDSQPGQGSCFQVVVPLGNATEPAGAPPSAPADRTSLAGRRLLVVDDDPDVLEGMRKLLEDWGCEVTAAPCGATALEGLDDPPRLDLVIADYRLADGELGTDVVRRVRERHAGVPALLITAETSREVQEALRASGIPHVGKPLRPHRLRALLDHLLAG